MAKLKTKQDIKDGTVALKQIMQENLAEISDNMIAQVLKNWRNLTQSQRFNAIKDVKAQGILSYKNALLSAYAVIASDAINKARKEVPKKRNVRLAELDEESLRLGEFDSLPADIQRRLKSMLDLLTGTQVSDLEKAVYFQFNSSVDTTDDEAVLNKDLSDSADEYIESASIQGAASANAGQIINEARLAFFQDDSVSEEIEAYEFVNADPVSPICTDLAGTVFAKDDPNLNRYWPPLHFNCKSYIVPILNGNLGKKEITSLEPSKASLNDYVQLSELKSGDNVKVLYEC